MRDPITIYELGKARQRELEAEASRYPSERVIRAEARNLLMKHKLTLALRSFALIALVIAQTFAS